jgi:hypothetical protein
MVLNQHMSVNVRYTNQTILSVEQVGLAVTLYSRIP